MNDSEDKIREFEQEIINLSFKLSSSSSPIGDWKIIKASEYNLKGLPVPYDMQEIMEERQLIRDRINSIQNTIEILKNRNE